MLTIQSELVTAIQGALARTDITSALCAEYIQRCEAKINRRLRTLNQETTNTSFSITAEYVNVPSGFLAVRAFQTTYAGARYSLTLAAQEQQTNSSTSGTGPPQTYSIVGAQFRFSPIPDATYTATLVYTVGVTALGTTGSNTNWALTTHPDMYLYGSLLEAEAYIQDDARVLMWKAGFDECIADVIHANQMNRWSGASLRTTPG